MTTPTTKLLADTFSISAGSSIQAQVAFIRLPGVDELDPTNGYLAIVHLHRELETLAPRVRIMSALVGAILVVPDDSADGSPPDLCALLAEILPGVHDRGLPVRVGVTHGEVMYLEDGDGRGNFIGKAVNAAARLAFAEGPGILFEQSFVTYRTRPLSVGAVKIDDNVIVTNGKRGERFDCYTTTSLPAVRADFVGSLPAIDGEGRTVNGVALVFDLPSFSDGSLAILEARFGDLATEVRKALSAWSQVKFFYAPGGDGGILVLSGQGSDRARRYLVDELRVLLERASGLNAEAADVRCRMGLHYGQIAIYKNAEGVDRPTGRVCFIADRLVSKRGQPGRVVYSKALQDTLARDEAEYESDYDELKPVDCPPDKNPVGCFGRKPWPVEVALLSGAAESKKTVPLDEIQQRVLKQIKASLAADTKLAAFMARTLTERGTKAQRENVAVIFTQLIAENFELALNAMIASQLHPELTGDWERFFRAVLPLSVVWKPGMQVACEPGLYSLPKGTPDMRGQLARDAIVGGSYSGSLEKPGSAGAHKKQVPTTAVAGIFKSEHLADIVDAVREKQARESLLDFIRRDQDVGSDWSAETLGQILQAQWKREPDPYFVVLEDTQKRLLQWLREDQEVEPVLKQLLIFQRTAQSPETIDLRISDGELLTIIKRFFAALCAAQKRIGNP